MADKQQTIGADFVSGIERAYPATVLSMLLRDRTTNKNIIWADSEYEALGKGYLGKDEITVASVTGLNSGVIKPRVAKERERQSRRTKSHAEVFTPTWLCNLMNGHIDEEWFGRSDVFNTQKDKTWITNENKIEFENKAGKTWKDYVDLRKLEITCGEAPFICSRYDTVSGEEIPLSCRVGFLDRKLRVVGENVATYDEWLAWAYRALESTYGYDYQGDNLVVARINVIQTFCEYLQDTWDKQPSDTEIKHAANIISWNIWQMDGLTATPPSDKLDKSAADAGQMNIFELCDDSEYAQAPFCKIYDWRAKKPQTYIAMRSEVNEL